MFVCQRFKTNRKKERPLLISLLVFLSLLSDSNQRPRDYKSRALANWAKEANTFKVERKTRLELATLTLARLCSTNWAISAGFVVRGGIEPPLQEWKSWVLTDIRTDLEAVWTGLEPATPCVTGRYSNQLNYHTNLFKSVFVSESECKNRAFFWNCKTFREKNASFDENSLFFPIFAFGLRPKT